MQLATMEWSADVGACVRICMCWHVGVDGMGMGQWCYSCHCLLALWWLNDLCCCFPSCPCSSSCSLHGDVAVVHHNWSLKGEAALWVTWQIWVSGDRGGWSACRWTRICLLAKRGIRLEVWPPHYCHCLRSARSYDSHQGWSLVIRQWLYSDYKGRDEGDKEHWWKDMYQVVPKLRVCSNATTPFTTSDISKSFYSDASRSEWGNSATSMLPEVGFHCWSRMMWWLQVLPGCYMPSLMPQQVLSGTVGKRGRGGRGGTNGWKQDYVTLWTWNCGR